MSIFETHPRNESRSALAGQALRVKPLLATAWGRALVAGIYMGLIPIIAVIWVFFDTQFANQFTQKEWEQWVFLRSLGLLGDALPWICLSVGVFLLGILIKRRNIATWAVFLCISIAVSGLVVNVIKFIFMRTRPNWYSVIPDGGSFSFPSGHSATIGAVAVVCMLRWPKLSPVALTCIALVGLNRIMSQNHHITDVIAGVAFGMTSTLVVQWYWWKYQPNTFTDMA